METIDELSITNNQIFDLEKTVVFSENKYAAAEDFVSSFSNNTIDGLDAGALEENTYSTFVPVAKLNGKSYDSLSKALSAVEAGDNTIILMSGTIDEDIVIEQAEGINITIQAETTGKAVMTGTVTIKSGSRQQMPETLTIKGIKFDASGASDSYNIIEVPASGEYRYAHNVTISECEFVGSENYEIAAFKENTGGSVNITIENCNGTNLHSLAQVKNINGFEILGCTLEDCTSGVNFNSSSNITMTGNKFSVKGYAARFGQGSVTSGEKTYILTDNVFKSDSSDEGRAAIILRNGAEDASITLTGNVITSGDGVANIVSSMSDSSSVNIVSADANYWGGANANASGINIVPNTYYADEALTLLINAESGLADTGRISSTAVFSFTKVDEGDDYITYDMAVKATEEGKNIANLVSAEAYISVTSPEGRNVGFDFLKSDYAVSTSPDGKYLFNLNNGTVENVAVRTGNEVVIARIMVSGYTHNITGEAQTAVVSTSGAFYNYEIMEDSLVKVSMPVDDSDLEYSKTVTSKKLTVVIDFPNAVENNVKAYQDMAITVSGGDLAAARTIDLGSDAESCVSFTDGSYVAVIEDYLTKDITYTVTVSGAGYRTVRKNVTMNTDVTLEFWNNVKDDLGADYLAGDIVKDNNINIYDLSAVVSYFGTNGMDTSAYHKYAKYDLNRDGRIDSKDVAYVLVSWNK